MGATANYTKAGSIASAFFAIDCNGWLGDLDSNQD